MILFPVGLLEQPQSKELQIGEGAKFTAEFKGDSPVSKYTWQKRAASGSSWKGKIFQITIYE